ncbi:MAG: hypothetical protein KC656_12110 [Myxococcales bacterium]|nr:hypothetical protein [Myxococcales bacterium]
MDLSTVRTDPVTGEVVVVSPRRIPPPPAFGRGSLPTVPSCPFCPGAEHLCEPEIARVPAGADWVARAFANRRPGLSLEDPAGRLPTPLEGRGGRGIHEVLVLGREHGALSRDDRYAGLVLAARRMADLARDPGLAALGWYRNRGLEAGSTQPHDHAQIVGMPVLPQRVARFVAAQQADGGLLPGLVERARHDGRLVAELDGVVAYCPWAPSVPFEVRLQPVAPVARWEDAVALLGPLATLLHALQEALDGMSGFTSTNLVLFAGPPRMDVASVRWQVRLLPRIVMAGGFEAWSGGAMQPIAPELAAEMLRPKV